jgi:SAM-dependent methyltransferase
MYFTGSAAGDYDVAPYDAAPAYLTSFEAIVAFAHALDLRSPISDVLDLGCGFGHQLAQVAPSTQGRLVGVDASLKTCEGARKILAPWSDRGEIIQADFGALDPARLGSFDLIYCVGTLYTVPSATRAALLRTIEACLRPNGLVLFTYYAGTKGYLKAAVARYLRSLQPGGQVMTDALQLARQQLAAAAQFPFEGALEPVLAQIEAVAASDNIVLAHEALGHGIEVQNTATLNDELMAASTGFVGYLAYNPSAFACDLAQRLYRAETLDLLEGGYRHALFARDGGQ